LISQIFTAVRRFSQHRFVRDTVILQSGQFVGIFLSGVTSILVSRILGPNLLGIYTLVLSMAAVMALLDLSASGRVALVEIARALGADDPAEVRDALAYFLRINLQLNGLLVLAFFLAAPPIAQLTYQNAEIGLWARWLGLIELTDLPYQVLNLAYQSQRQMHVLVRLETFRLALQSAAMIMVLVLGWGIPALVVSQLATSVGFSVFSFLRYRQLALADARFPSWGIMFRRMSSVGVRSRLSLGVRVALDKNLGGFITQLPVLLLGTVNQTAVGYFGTALKVITLPQPLVSGVARNLDTFLPFQSGQRQSSLRSAFVRSTVYTGLLWSAVTVVFGLAAAPLLVIVYGWDYAPAIPMLFPLLLQSLAVGLGVGLGSTLRTLDKVQYSIGNQILSLAVIGPIGYWAIVHFGGYGAAWFYGLWYLAATSLGIGMTLWLLRRTREPHHFKNSTTDT
jgi:O-antigen/teichoic acid export membrane protein